MNSRAYFIKEINDLEVGPISLLPLILPVRIRPWRDVSDVIPGIPNGLGWCVRIPGVDSCRAW
jgi:hypothetical protein